MKLFFRILFPVMLIAFLFLASCTSDQGQGDDTSADPETQAETTAETDQTQPDETTAEEEETQKVMDIYGNGYNANMIVGFDEQGHTVSAVSAARENKQVGIFYFLWLGQPMASDIYDVSRIIEENGKEEVFFNGESKISPNGQAHWWAKPLYGYYNSGDEWVIRRHLEMLTDAGVDFLVFDTTNAVTYDNVAKKVMKVITELRAEGWDAPQVVYYTHTYSIRTIQNIYENIYKQNVYPESWYRVDGKPMIIGYTKGNKDAEVSGDPNYNPGDLPKELRDFFYIRQARWPNDPLVKNSWPYTEWEWPQKVNTDMISVSVATHPMVPFSFSLTHENWCNWGRGYDVKTGLNIHEDIMKGTFYDSEWQTVYNADPDFVFVTGWNEWVAYKQPYGGEYMLCDNVDMEYSRDTDPMEGGYEDAYFIQTIDRIRKYKYQPLDGILAYAVRKTIDINGAEKQWNEVNAVYRRVGTDDGARNSYGGANTVHYDADPVRNNILEVKVTNDADNIYMLIKCRNEITGSDADNFMNIFIGRGTPDMNKGWEGYEFALNRKRSGKTADIETLKADFSGEKIGSAEFSFDGKIMQIAIPKSALGISDGDDIYFKVADGVEDPAEIMNYYASGRCLPLGRLSYLYQVRSDDGRADGEVIDRHFPPVPQPTLSDVPATVEQTGKDPAKTKIQMIDIAGAENSNQLLSLADLSMFGIVPADSKIEDEKILFTFENAQSAGWCQTIFFNSTNTLKNALDHFDEDLYLRIWVETSEDLTIDMTVQFNGAERTYLDPKTATLTKLTGETVPFNVGNATSDAGPQSSLRILGGFRGWVAFRMTDTKRWTTDNSNSPTYFNLFSLDIRPTSPGYDSYYKLGDICLADTTAGGLYTVTGSTTEYIFDTPADQLYYTMDKLTRADVQFSYCPEYDPVGYDGVKAIWLTGMDMGGKSTRVFAYIGIPEGADVSAKVPGVVLQHGGGGYAYPNWVKMWNDAGYAAIAIANTGYYPAKKGMTDFYGAASWTHTLSAELAADGRVLPPDNDGVMNSEAPLDRQWMYHAVGQTIIGANILRTFAGVDGSKIGMTGISWGGMIVSTAVGLDDRFAFAIPVYGSAFVDKSLAWSGTNYNSAGTKELWEPSNRIDYVDTPMLWVCWSNDTCFSLNSNNESYLHTRDYSYLCALNDLGHGHIEGWTPPEIIRFADSAVKDGAGLLKVTKEPTEDENRLMTCTFKAPSDAKKVTARICYITEQMSYSLSGIQSKQNPTAYGSTKTMDQKWHFADCTVENGTATIQLPESTYAYYVEFTVRTEGGKYITTSSFTERK